MENIIKIEKNSFNILKKNHQKLIKNLVNLDSDNINNTDLLKLISLVNNSVGNLNNIINNCNLQLLRMKKGEENMSQELNTIIENYKEAEEIIRKFLPLMLMYQMRN